MHLPARTLRVWFRLLLMLLLCASTAPVEANNAKAPHKTIAWCSEALCSRRSAFMDIEDNSRRWCAKHRNATSVASTFVRRCKFDGCEKQPSYGEKRGQPVFCREHKLPEHLNVNSRKCEAPGCNIRPYFAPPGAKRGRFCRAHKEEGHIDVVSLRCSVEGCLRQRVYSSPLTEGGPLPRYCATHKGLKDVDKRTKRCSFGEGCQAVAVFGPVHEGQPQLCSLHRDVKHINCR